MPSQEELKNLFLYDENSGRLYWRVTNSPRAKKGSVAGHKLHSRQSIQVRVNKKLLFAHRIIWVLVHGALDDTKVIDHINGCPSDNRLSNLRVVTQSENLRNSSLQRNNTSGCNGVNFEAKKNRWRARLQRDGRTVHLGYFPTYEEACEARKRGDKIFGFSDRHGKVDGGIGSLT